MFQNTNYSMVIVLPNEIDGLNNVEAKLSSNFEEVLSDLLDKYVEVKIPKFKIEAKLDLQSVLEKVSDITHYKQMLQNQYKENTFLRLVLIHIRNGLSSNYKV